MRVNESGRSMIEMLGVLAIIGVLSVGGIAGYSKAMNKYKTNKVADNVSMIITNIRTLYAQQTDFEGLDNVSAVNMGIVPDELISEKTEADGVVSAVTLKNAYLGDVTISASAATDGIDSTTGANKAFYVTFAGLAKEACVTLATNDWGSNYSSGLIGLKVGGAADKVVDDNTNLKVPCVAADGSATTAGVACPGKPMNVAKAANACSCASGSNTCAITWKYY